MKPFIKNPSKRHGGTQEHKHDSWGFQRKMIARLKVGARQNRRRSDRLAIYE